MFENQHRIKLNIEQEIFNVWKSTHIHIVEQAEMRTFFPNLPKWKGEEKKNNTKTIPRPTECKKTKKKNQFEWKLLQCVLH